ncbi:uncharacterized protein LOC133191275 [Saccostrea echinata]|uniref:uncharacterized protein LOC133191275 n=1 Tax=Saccostrea echinata TaxID=191078 RepID=UPI002A82EA15|nr:uncharacterized protein LOC133191275 [Saccostrea echinata]
MLDGSIHEAEAAQDNMEPGAQHDSQDDSESEANRPARQSQRLQRPPMRLTYDQLVLLHHMHGHCRASPLNTGNTWKTVIFSDETKIMLGTDRKVYVWRKADEKWRPECLELRSVRNDGVRLFGSDLQKSQKSAFIYSKGEISAQTDKNACSHKDGTLICCSGFYLFNGSCIECFGAYGENCNTPCRENFYGYRCKETCFCTKYQVCNKYLGCQQNAINVHDVEERECSGDRVVLVLVIGLGSVTLSASLVFVGIMFCKWRIHLQRRFKIGEDNTRGFRVNLLSFPGKQEIFSETYMYMYDDVQESKIILDGKKNEERETGEYRINSTEYNQLFNNQSISKKKPNHEEGKEYDSVDARFQRDSVLVTLSEFPGDDCYISISQNGKRLRRISKSCSDLKAVTSKPYNDIFSNYYDGFIQNMSEKAALNEHL